MQASVEQEYVDCVGWLGRRRGETGGMAVGKDDRRQCGAHTL
ncbi:hypothetical protein [Rugosimonospora africana]|nr:hypothetical protein [Rugosimonospora africana]